MFYVRIRIRIRIDSKTVGSLRCSQYHVIKIKEVSEIIREQTEIVLMQPHWLYWLVRFCVVKGFSSAE